MLPDRPVRRTVQGVSMVVPRRHPLPYFAWDGSPYGQNLVELGRMVTASRGRVTLLDIGANIGDSTAQVLDASPGEAVCVEPDPQWHRYLQTNALQQGRAVLEPSLLVPTIDATAAETGKGWAPVHHAGGTTRFERRDTGRPPHAITPLLLLERYPQLASVGLIKSDTDGFDPWLIPSVASAFAMSSPILFFEYDPHLALLALPNDAPGDIWAALADLGYDGGVVWNNYGELLGQGRTSTLARQARGLEEERRTGYFWDVAMVMRESDLASLVLDRWRAPLSRY